MYILEYINRMKNKNQRGHECAGCRRVVEKKRAHTRHIKISQEYRIINLQNTPSACECVAPLLRTYVRTDYSGVYTTRYYSSRAERSNLQFTTGGSVITSAATKTAIFLDFFKQMDDDTSLIHKEHTNITSGIR